MAEKILVVDDDIDSLKLIGLMLQRHGYDVIAANTGKQALTKATGEQPNLIILDVMMPDMSGYEVCRRLRADADTKAIPIIMFTAKTLIDDKVAGFEAGADDYLTKPTHPAELASRVRAILARNPDNRQAGDDSGVTIGVMGSKGGVGTTTTALNLGAALLLSNQNPIVAEFRLGSGSLGLALGMDNVQGLAAILSKPTAEINGRLIEEQLITHQSGLRILPSSVRAKEAQLNFPVESALALVRTLRQQTQITILDLGSRLSPMVNRLQREMDQMILVVEPLPISLRMAREVLHELEAGRSVADSIHVVVVNRAQAGMQTPWHEVEQMLGQEIRAIISSATDLSFQALQTGVPMVMFQPNAIVSSQFLKLAQDLSARIEAQTNDQSNQSS